MSLPAEKEYFANLGTIQSMNPPAYALLPAADRIYNIDINNRTIEAPKFLGVEKDQKSGVVYFSVDRYVDYMDLTKTCCIIQFNNKYKQSRYYIVPFYDVYKLAHERKIVFPWCLDSHVTDYPGAVEFSIRFFKCENILNSQNEAVPTIVYNLSTLPARSTILEGIPHYDPKDNVVEDKFPLLSGEAANILSYITTMEKYNKLYWTILDDTFISPVNSDEIQDELLEIMNNQNKIKPI